MGGGWQVPLGPWLMLGICRFSVLVLHETLLVPVLMYGMRRSDLDLWLYRWTTSEDRVPNAWIRELCRMKKGLGERIDEVILQWFGHMERMESDRIAKRVLCRSVCW